jgi:hypothetical protein
MKGPLEGRNWAHVRVEWVDACAGKGLAHELRCHRCYMHMHVFGDHIVTIHGSVVINVAVTVC